MKKNIHHSEILERIKEHSGKATRHTFLDSYLGNDHLRYAINAAQLRQIAKEWMKAHTDLRAEAFAALLTHLIKGESSTEKWIAGLMMDYSKKEQRKFHPQYFDNWLDHLTGWAEVDAVCTGPYTITEIPVNFKQWKPLLKKFSKSDNINKRRASLVLLCSPVSQHHDEQLAAIALENMERLKAEKHVLITKAISWLLRSMIKHYAETVKNYVEENADTLPKIAVRETRIKLQTGKKTSKAGTKK